MNDNPQNPETEQLSVDELMLSDEPGKIELTVYHRHVFPLESTLALIAAPIYGMMIGKVKADMLLNGDPNDASSIFQTVCNRALAHASNLMREAREAVKQATKSEEPEEPASGDS